MDRQDIMATALQLQRDAGLMASNLQVLGQYVFPSDAVNFAAPGAPRGHPDGSDGIVATTSWPR